MLEILSWGGMNFFLYKLDIIKGYYKLKLVGEKQLKTLKMHINNKRTKYTDTNEALHTWPHNYF